MFAVCRCTDHVWPPPGLPIKLWESGLGAEVASPRVSFGGAGGIRTPDLVIANDALSQLSYSPLFSVHRSIDTPGKDPKIGTISAYQIADHKSQWVRILVLLFHLILYNS